MTYQGILQAIKTYYFPVFMSVALLVYTAQRLELPLPSPFNNYLNDVLCMPIVLKICQYAIRFLKNNQSLQIPFALVLTLTLGYAIYFEWLLPHYDLRYTGDSLDVLLYVIGALFFMGIERYRTGKTTIFERKQKV